MIIFFSLFRFIHPQPSGGPPPSTSVAPPPSASIPMASGPRPVFPAYQQQPPPSGEPRGGGGGGGEASSAGGMPPPTLPEVSRKPAEKVPSVGPGCKLMHPEDDLSLVSCFLAIREVMIINF